MTAMPTRPTTPPPLAEPAKPRLVAVRLAPAGCDRRLWGSESGLTCTREAGHPGGHVYLDPTGSDVPDRHRDGGHG